MNILPLILALVLMLSILTVERLEKFKNQTIVQVEYHTFLQENERQVFNLRQERLHKISQRDHRQLGFRFFVDKTLREKNENIAKQNRLIVIEFLKILYGEANFFKELEEKRANFLEEMLDAIEQAAQEAPEKLINRIEDIARLKLEDSELQEAFYKMLKGTLPRERLKELQTQSLKSQIKGKAYPPLLTYIHYNDKQIIDIQYAPKELLKAIFIKDDIVEAIVVRRNELAKSKDAGAKVTFENEFKEKRRAGIDDTMLDFKISTSEKTDYD